MIQRWGTLKSGFFFMWLCFHHPKFSSVLLFFLFFLLSLYMFAHIFHSVTMGWRYSFQKGVPSKKIHFNYWLHIRSTKSTKSKYSYDTRYQSRSLNNPSVYAVHESVYNLVITWRSHNTSKTNAVQIQNTCEDKEKSFRDIAKLTHCRKLIFMLELSTKNMSLCRNSMKRITISFITTCAVKGNLYKYFRYKYRLHFSFQVKKIT